MAALFKNAKKASSVKQTEASEAKNPATSQPVPGVASAAPTAKSKKTVVKKGFFIDAPVGDRPLPYPEQEDRRHAAIVRRIVVQGVLLIVLVITYLGAVPLFSPTMRYHIRRDGQPLGTEQSIYGLSAPVLTQAAILSWASTAVTEIMTFNFADYNQRISLFSDRFLPESWTNFITALLQQDIINKFKRFNLVLTAAPSAPPVIIEEGPDEETGEYRWIVQVPVILSYVTNNNKRSVSRQVVELTLVRVSTLENAYGIAIKVWQAK